MRNLNRSSFKSSLRGEVSNSKSRVRIAATERRNSRIRNMGLLSKREEKSKQRVYRNTSSSQKSRDLLNRLERGRYSRGSLSAKKKSLFTFNKNGLRGESPRHNLGSLGGSSDHYYFKSPSTTQRDFNHRASFKSRKKEEITLTMVRKPKDEEDVSEMVKTYDRLSLKTDRTSKRKYNFGSTIGLTNSRDELSPSSKIKMRILRSKIDMKMQEGKGVTRASELLESQSKPSLGYFKKRSKGYEILAKKKFKINDKDDDEITPKKQFETYKKKISTSTKKNMLKDLENLITKESSNSTFTSHKPASGAKEAQRNDSKFLYKPEKSLLKDISDLKKISQYLKNSSKSSSGVKEPERERQVDHKNISAILKKYEITPKRDGEIEAIDDEFDCVLGLKDQTTTNLPDETLDSTLRVINRKIAAMEGELYNNYGIKF